MLEGPRLTEMTAVFLSGVTVGKWSKRYRDLGKEGSHDELRLGRHAPIRMTGWTWCLQRIRAPLCLES